MSLDAFFASLTVVKEHRCGKKRWMVHPCAVPTSKHPGLTFSQGKPCLCTSVELALWPHVGKHWAWRFTNS